MSPRRGEVWWGEHEGFGRRPYLVMTRDVAIGVLDRLIVVPLTRTIRGIPTEVRLDRHDGVPEECAVSLDNLGVVPKGNLTERICTLSPDRLAQVCAALSAAVDC